MAASAPRLSPEQVAADVEELLGLPVSSLGSQSLAELGASSLDATRLAVLLRRKYGVSVRAADLFRSKALPTCLHALSERQTSWPAQRRFTQGERVPLTWQQRGVWFGSMLDPVSPRYHFHAILNFSQSPEIIALRASLAVAIRQCPAMRIRLLVEGAQAWQIVPAPNVTADELPLTEVKLEKLPKSAEDLVASVGGDHPFDLSRGPLVRWTLAHLADGSAALVHTEHHLIHDGLSFEAFLHCLEHPSASSPDYSYFEYAKNQQSPSESELKEVAKLFLGADLSRFSGTSDGVDRCLRFPVPGRLLEAVRSVAREAGVSLFTALFAAFSHAVGEHQNRDAFIIGTGVGNRPANQEDTVGMYVSLTPVFAVRDLGNSPKDHLRRTHDLLSDGINRAYLPIQDVVRVLGPAVRGENALFCAAFSMHEQKHGIVQVADQTATVTVGIFNGSAKQAIDAVVVLNDNRAEILVEADGNVAGADDLRALWKYMVDWLRRLTGLLDAEQTWAGL